MSDPNNDSIPVLHEVLVQGHSVQARQASNDAAEFDTPREPGFKAEPVLAPQPVLTPEQMSSVQPTLEPQPLHATGQLHHPEQLAQSAGVFDRAEPPTPLEAGATVPPDIAREGVGEPHLALDAEVIAERLRRRVAGFLAGDGRSVVEERCRETLQAHTGWLIDQITREVAHTLESEMTGWVREAVSEEIARRSSGKA